MKVALISCLKQDDSLMPWDEIPAEKLFISDFVKFANIYSEKIYGAERIYFLSTKYALVKPQQIISPYENNFGDIDMQQRRCRKIISELILDGCNLENDEFLILADEHYTTHIKEAKMIQNINMPLHGMHVSDALDYLVKALNDRELLSPSDIARWNTYNLFKTANDILND